MTDAGAAAGAAEPDPQLIVAERQYQQGIQAIRDDRLADAVNLFSQCLEARVGVHGAHAEECGSVYWRYGAALFYKAQDESDVFSDQLQGAAIQHDDRADGIVEAGDDSAAAAQPSASGARPAPGAGPCSDASPSPAGGPSSGAGPSRAAEAEGDGSGAEDEDGGSAQQGEEDMTDMQLAWQMLEMAKLILGRNEAKNALDLADVYLLLADVSAEGESFATAVGDYEKALQLLTGPLPEGGKRPVRRVAEVHYKAALALQLTGQLPEALRHSEAAVAVCKDRVQELQSAAAAEDSSEAAAPSKAARTEAEALQGFLPDLEERVEELKGLVAAEEEKLRLMKSDIKKTLEQLAGAAAPGQPAAARAPVQDLGAVGRGKKRITLQPTTAQPQVDGGADGRAAPSADPPAKKRSLEDAMGGGSFTEGFGAPSAVRAKQEAAFSAPPAAPAAAHPQTQANGSGAAAAAAVGELPAASGAPAPAAAVTASAAAPASAVPAFLQPAAVAAAYAGSTAPTSAAL